MSAYGHEMEREYSAQSLPSRGGSVGIAEDFFSSIRPYKNGRDVVLMDVDDLALENLREKIISEGVSFLQDLVPGCSKVAAFKKAEAKISILASKGNGFQTIVIGVVNTSAMAKSSCGSISNPHGYNDLLAVAKSLRMTIGNAY
ncbi:hypothetical protein BUALT_Bualt17G0050600 [Buddleja alternifolia]|uniref:Uncharacterized protein n=1 Tax=Buddleja alternifolia TaxID=168488 RepID=A0AAV6WH03_9LAMI|nr:hypothetical protein BUALT_Bualt17G0050600 [Buddleja alternifolia]